MNVGEQQGWRWRSKLKSGTLTIRLLCSSATAQPLSPPMRYATIPTLNQTQRHLILRRTQYV